MKFLALIPSRYASTRFPGKPLAEIGGKPIVQHVYERAKEVFDDVYVATDDERIRSAVEQFGGKAVMTRTDHRSGTDRCYEALRHVDNEHTFDVVVNIQGDEPFIQPSQLHSIRACFEDERTQIATLVKPFACDAAWETLENPNSPKVVTDGNGFALYFSRSVIPYLRGVERAEWLKTHEYYKHIGLYAYRTDVLREITSLPQSTLERAESLEQLRWLQAGYKIKVEKTDVETIGIDTPEDLAHAQAFFAALHESKK